MIITNFRRFHKTSALPPTKCITLNNNSSNNNSSNNNTKTSASSSNNTRPPWPRFKLPDSSARSTHPVHRVPDAPPPSPTLVAVLTSVVSLGQPVHRRCRHSTPTQQEMVVTRKSSVSCSDRAAYRRPPNSCQVRGVC